MTQDARLMDFVRLKNGAIGQVIGISPTEIAIYDENAWQETKLKWKSKLPSNHNYTIYPKSDIENIYPVDKNSHIKKYSQICKISEIERKNGNYLVSGYTYNSGWNSLRAVKDPVTKQWITAQQPPFEFEKISCWR